MAFNAVEEVFAIFPWLRDLGDEVFAVIVAGVTENLPLAVIQQNIRDTSAYQTRFAGLLHRQTAGLPAINEAEYLQIENGYLQQLRNYNILGTLGLEDTESLREFAADLIGKDVSVQEFNRRLDGGVSLMRDSSEFVQQAFEEFYGVRVTDDAFLSYFLDPELGLDIIEDQLMTARIGGSAFRFGLNVSQTRAEILRQGGVTADLARQGFSDIAREEPVLSRLASIHRINPLSQQELEEFFFHDDPNISQRRNQIFTTSLAAFQEGGARNVSKQGGLGELVDPNRTV